MLNIGVSLDEYTAAVKLLAEITETNKQLVAEIKALRGKELMTREMIAAELGGKIKPSTVDYYLKKGLTPIRIGKSICVCTRAEFERWCSNDPVNFHKK